MTLELFTERLELLKANEPSEVLLEGKIRTLEDEYLCELYSHKKGDIITKDNISIEISNITKTNKLSGEPYYIYTGVILTEGIKPKNKKFHKYKSFNSFDI